MQRRSIFIALPIGLLSACAGRLRSRTEHFWAGRMGLQVQTDPPRDWQAGFELRGSAEQGDLTLLSPLGTVLAHLSWQPGKARLEQGEQRWVDTSVDALALRLTRTPLPLNALFDWLDGRHHESEGWTADLSAWSTGRIQAQRQLPAPAARLRIVLEP